MSDRIVSIGLGEFSVSVDPETTLVAYGLGSCIGLTLYDPTAGAGGMAHVVLPERPSNSPDDGGARYADTAVDRLAAELERSGGKRGRMVVKMAGGAQLLTLPLNGRRWDIGERNINAMRKALTRCGLTLATYDVGGAYGRTVRLRIHDGRVAVSIIGRGEKFL
ncbi:MAG: chemotaxis protein CheD [Bacillota bacterium]